MAMEDPQPQKRSENNQKRKNKKKNNNIANNENNPKEAVQKKIKPKKKVQKAKENGDNKLDVSEDGHSDVFVFDEIANNEDASALISALVNCYTCNSTLPQSELDTLNKTLYEKTVSVFLQILNNCVNKIYNKLIKTGYYTDFVENKVARKDAFCQTDISYRN